MYTFLCEDSTDGIFTAIYNAYESQYGHSNIRLQLADSHSNYELFQEYIPVDTDTQKSEKVARTLRKHLGAEVYSALYQASISDGRPQNQKHWMDKADAIYKSVVLGLSLPNGNRLMDYLHEPYVRQVFLLNRSSSNELDHLLGFLRFQELENGLLFAMIHPKNDILALISDHFCDRLPQENFIIYDENRKKASLHKKGSAYLLANASEINDSFIHNYSKNELEYQRLWKGFFDSIAIPARSNPKLQNQNIPKRFQKDAIEFRDIS